jgi:hypothetical protein
MLFVLMNSMNALDSLIVSPIRSPFTGPFDFSMKILLPEVVQGLKLFESGLTIHVSVIRAVDIEAVDAIVGLNTGFRFEFVECNGKMSGAVEFE